MIYTHEQFHLKQHPDEDVLLHCISREESGDYDALYMHLAECQTCRQTAETLMQLKKYRHTLPVAAVNDEQQKLIVDYMDDTLADKDKIQARQSILKSPDTLKAALHYASHCDAMKHAMMDTGASRESETVKSDSRKSSESTRLIFSRFSQWVDFLKQIIPVPGSIHPAFNYSVATAFALIVTLGLVYTISGNDRDDYIIASYQDSPVIKYTSNDALPGMGFFSQAGNPLTETKTETFEDVQVSIVNNRTIKISWPEIKGVKKYTMRVQQTRNGKPAQLEMVHTEKPSVEIDMPSDILNASSSGQRYEWVLYGRTASNRNFYAEGGFVINRQ